MDWKMIPFFLAGLLPALTFHEWGHAFVASRFGDPTPKMMGRLTLNPLSHLDPMGTIVLIVTGFIGWAKPVPINPAYFKSTWGEFWVASAGPLMNILLAVVGSVFYKLGAPLWLGPENFQALATFFQIFIFMNLGLAFFNLIPIGPLDGSHLLARLLPLRQSIAFREWNARMGSMVLFGIILAESFTKIGIIRPVVRGAVMFCADFLLG